MSPSTLSASRWRFHILLIISTVWCICTLNAQVPVKIRSLEFESSTSGTVTLESAVESTTYTLKLPSTAGPAGAILMSNGSSGLQWSQADANGWAITGNIGLDSSLHYFGSQNELVAQPLIFRTDGVERLRVAGGSGFIGIGTAQPTAQLHIQGVFNDAVALRIRASNSNLSNIIVVENASGTGVMVLSPGGNLGVGSNANPQTTLSVDGGITLRSATVNVTGDNQVITMGNRSVLVLNSNNPPLYRTITLANGMQVGQLLYLLVTGVAGNGVELADNPAIANTNLSAAWLAESGDSIQLLWDGADWIELSRSNN